MHYFHYFVSAYFFVFLLIRHASELGVVLFALLGVVVLVVPNMRRVAFASMSGWQRQDTAMALVFSSVFMFKLIASSWSASPQLGLSNALWHAHFAVWPLVFVAMLYCKPQLNQVLSGLSLALIFTGVWTAWSLFSGHPSFYPLVFKINTGVLAQLVLVCGSLLLVAASTQYENKRVWHRYLYTAGLIGALIVLYFSDRRTEWLAFFALASLINIWQLRNWFTPARAVLAACIFFAALLLIVYLRQERFALAYREIVHYFTVLGLDSSAVNTSVGARLEMYRLGLSAFLDHPFFGMGSGVRPYLLQAYGGLGESQLPHRHFHSEYLQTLVEGGIVWALLLSAAIVYWFKRAMFASYQHTHLLATLAASLSMCYLLSGSISAGLIYGPANALLVMCSALIWVCIRQKSMINAAQKDI